MEDTAYRAIAIVGAGAVMPDAANVKAFWENVKQGRYSISEVTPDRWNPDYYYDADHSAPDKTYSKIGGWVREHEWNPIKWRMPIPPRVADAMDGTQKWAMACTREALEDYGYPKRPLNLDRTAVILGNAMAGEKHYISALRVYFPEYAHELEESPSFAALPESMRHDISRELHQRMSQRLPEITEDSMPGELANCIAGRIANVFNFHGPNYVVDAACASAMAAMSAAIEGLVARDFDVAVTGGVDRNMGAPTFVKFCKIGALSATGTRPYAEGADGFVMGEGSAVFVMKRLADAERDDDKIYAVLRGIGGASDGRGKGITAPNPVGQILAIERGWKNAGVSPDSGTLFEGHGTSTRVGDMVEVQSMAHVLDSFHLPHGSVALGSVKSNIGHLKGAAGAAGLLKAALALRDKVLPPSVHCENRNPDIDFANSPLYVNTTLKPWTVPEGGTRRAGLSAFGFGGTNFHAVIEEYIPHKLTGNGKRSVAVGAMPSAGEDQGTMISLSSSKTISNTSSNAAYDASTLKAPLRGALVIGANSASALAERLRTAQKDAAAGQAPAPCAPAESDLRAAERVAIDYADAADLSAKSANALKALAADQAPVWKALRAQGIFRGHGPAAKVAFLYTGQGSQYVNMLRPLYTAEPIVSRIFAEADRVMTPLIGKPLTEFVFVDGADPKAVAQADEDLRQTAITQPAVLAIDWSLTQLLAAYGIQPDLAMGHSLGEYGALVAVGALTFENALIAVSARGRGMTNVAVEDTGKMAAVFAPMDEIERVLKSVNGYVVIANFNSDHQAVIGGASKAVEQAIEIFKQAGYEPVELPVSHAFHTSIVAPASGPLRLELERLHVQSPRLPIVANVDGEFYPMGPDVVPQMLDLLSRQVASPVQFVKGLRTLYDAGARIFVEVGPKKALQGFAEDVLGSHGDVLSLFTNHPKVGDTVAFNQALCGLYAAGLGRGHVDAKLEAPAFAVSVPILSPKPLAPAEFAPSPVGPTPVAPAAVATAPVARFAAAATRPAAPLNGDRYAALGHLFSDFLDQSMHVYQGGNVTTMAPPVVTGAALGLPGTDHIFDDSNVGRILRGDQFIDVIPTRFRKAMLDKHITRLVKNEHGGPTFETIDRQEDVIKLAARGGAFDLEKEFGVSTDRLAALDRGTQLAMAAGLDALRDAGIPLVLSYKTTSIGTQLPDRWRLPDDMRDDTGVIFGSAFPGFDSFADEMSRYYADHARREQLAEMESVRARGVESNGHSALGQELDRKIADLRAAVEKDPYVFDRRFLFKTLAMGHSQFAEFIGARGPNTQINSACATTTQALTLAEDWIRAGRCRRVIIITADDVTSDSMLEWIGAGFLASGAAATDAVVEDAAIPFDRRRHGMIIGMGAAALVVESVDAARERGIQPICEVLSSVTANSAFHGSRLDVQHIGQVMETLIAQAETRSGVSRQQIAPETVFVSHETYTPARGGSASAEIYALRRVFGADADRIVIANTKGFTGHAMATGIEDVVAVKALETGCVPPVANFKEVDPELGPLNLSKGGAYPVEYALHLGAGFGSQISMTLLHRVMTKNGVRPSPNALGYATRIADTNVWNAWLSRMAGRPVTTLEVVHRTLRVPDQGLPARVVEVAKDSRPALLPTIQATPPPPVLVEVAKTSATIPLAPLPIVALPRAPLPPASLPSIAPPKAPAGDPVKARVLALVAEKTGYPVDMLDLDLDLEADLGVDTVKQAEVMATIREAYGIARDDKVKLRDYPTLAHVIRFVHERRPDLATAALPPAVAETREPIATPAPSITAPSVTSPSVTAASVPSPSVAPSSVSLAHDSAGDPVKERILTLAEEKTGYPRDMLDLDLDLEADLGVDTVKQAEMLAAVREIYGIVRDDSRKLRDYPTLAHVIRFVYEKRPDLVGVEAASASIIQPPSPAISPAPSPEIANDPIREKILEIVAEKTGYPKDMLDLDLDLEADLGVDTVKQAEVFALVRAAYNIPRDENMKLRDFPTLAHVIQFARERSGQLIVPNAPAVAPLREQAKDLQQPVASPASFATTPVAPALASFGAANRIPRRVPVPNLRPALTLCKPTGVTLRAGSRVVMMRDKGGVAEKLSQRLNKLKVEVLRLDASDADAVAEQLKGWLATGPIQGVYWLPALDHEGNLSGMDLATWQEGLRVRLKLFYTTMRVLYEQVAAPGTFLVSATRLGGQHGYDPAGAVAPMGGAVVGLTKTYKRERMDALVKAVDFEATCKPREVADLLLEETLRDPGAIEIGYQGGQRWTVGLQEQPADDGRPGLTLDKNTVFVVTGAAGSIVSAITADLAAASGGTFYLLDLVPEPDSANPDLERFVSDKEGLKQDLFARMKASGKRATPALVEKELVALERANAAWSAISAVRAAGGTAHYFSVNLTDAESVAGVIQQVRERSGRVDVLLHAAGIERSHFLPDKDQREFDLVFDVKSHGWFHLLRAIGDMPLGATVAFSSIAGRFGNGGQADYSSANDLLCKITSSFRITRPATRGIVVDWTAWGGIGMATRGSIPKMMELAGIDMLPPEAGIPLIRRELTTGGTRGEIVVGKRLGILLDELDPTGGLNITSVDIPGAQERQANGPMIGTVTSMGVRRGLTVETVLDPAVQAFLHDHQIEGTPVLPGVMGMEAFAEVAQWMLPGWQVAAIEDVNFLAPFKFYRKEPRTVTIEAVFRPEGDEIIADCRLTGQRLLPNQADPQVTTHFTGRVRLTRHPSEVAAAPAMSTPDGAVVEAADIYRVYFHGPAYQVLERAWWDGNRMVGQMASGLPENHHPSERPTVTNPRMIELCFQAAGLWELEVNGRMGLPQQVAELRLLHIADPADGPLYAVVTPEAEGVSFAVEVLTAVGTRCMRLMGYRTVTLTDGVDRESLQALQAAMTLHPVLA